MKLIGLSLSMCVKDVIEGKVSIADIDSICAGTRIMSDDDLVEVCKTYSEIYWSKAPMAGTLIALWLYHFGRLFQPRTVGLEAPSMGGYLECPWVEIPQGG